jgi:hypothetical protein
VPPITDAPTRGFVEIHGRPRRDRDTTVMRVTAD